MSEPLKLDDIRLRYTEDVLERKLEILRAARLDVKANKLEAIVGVIGKAIAKYVEKLARQKKYPLHLIAFSLELVTTNMCSAIYDAAASNAEDEG